MRFKWVLCVLLGAAVTGYAKDVKPYQTARLLQMNSVQCGTDEKSDRSALGEIIGTDNSNRKTQQLLCQEYVLQSDTVTYHIRPRDEKHPEVLPVGSQAQFRLDKDKLLLRVEGMGEKERQYTVISAVPRNDNSTAQAAPAAAQATASARQ